MQENARNSLVKRKIPDTFYAPPILKTQVFSNEQRSHINHTHTNSLPLHDHCIATINNLTGSYTNLCETTQCKFEVKQQPDYVNDHMLSNSLNHANMNENISIQPSFANHFSMNHSQHSKTYSLPVLFEQPSKPHKLNDPVLNFNDSNFQNFQPPIPNKNQLQGYVPLPEGFSCETTPTGEVFFINHITKTTQWHDPRSLNNMPMNQNEINKDLRQIIINTTQMPPNWEEARTANGEIYFIDHKNQTTSWTDPRISVYMKNESIKYSNYNTNIMENEIKLKNDSKSSLLSPFSSASSSSSSNVSLNMLNQQKGKSYEGLTAVTNKNYSLINSLKKKLDNLQNQKSSICKQLEELSKKETSLKSKLSPQDLDDVFKILKTGDTSLNSFSWYNHTSNGIQTSFTTNFDVKNSEKLNDKTNLDNSNLDADSTIVANNSALNSSH